MFVKENLIKFYGIKKGQTYTSRCKDGSSVRVIDSEKMVDQDKVVVFDPILQKKFAMKAWDLAVVKYKLKNL